MGLRHSISRQFSHPSGIAGRVVAALMNRGNRAINAGAIERLAVQPGDRVLDIGFGGGATLGVLRDAGATVSGVDRAVDMVAAARKAHPDLQLVEGDVTALPFEADAFDAVLSVNTVYFWRDLAAALAEIRRVLAPGGRLVLGIRDPDSIDRVSPEVFTLRQPAEIADAAKAAGFGDARVDSPEGERFHFVVGTA